MMVHIYVLPEEQLVHKPTKEELAEVERQSAISELQNQIQQKKDELAKTDYIPGEVIRVFFGWKRM